MFNDGRVQINPQTLKQLRRENCLSQEKLAQLCSQSKIAVSISTIKRAETGKYILYRSASNLAQIFKISTSQLIINSITEVEAV
ncbi:MAG: XRE family transcriptional regulator [Saccharospirillaceae bacterium]|nr:hypothetical protein [Pseudomonadales bacterium]NRB79919.1 XRE family transcriptional regulator [Saccharospirillaceae bacterium]